MADPMYAPTDWLAAYDRLRAQPMQQPEGAQWQAGGMPPWWWEQQRVRESHTPGLMPQTQGVEAIPLGDIADPVSQLAFLLSPHLLAGMKAIGAQAAQPGYSRGFGGMMPQRRLMLGERGNLGPPPVGPQGEPLPESVVRGPQGELQQLFHGTPSAFPDFDMSKMSPEGLYGPGVYMTNSPNIAGGYVTKGMPGGQGSLLAAQAQMKQANELRQLAAAQPRTVQGESARAFYEARAASADQQSVDLLGGFQPNIRPLYADLKKPFAIDQPVPEEVAKKLWDMIPDHLESFKNAFSGVYRRGEWHASGDDVYQILAKRVLRGDKAKLNTLLQEAGYDGLTHIGGGNTGNAPHRVYIAFGEDTVYPSFNVDAMRPPGGAR